MKDLSHVFGPHPSTEDGHPNYLGNQSRGGMKAPGKIRSPVRGARTASVVEGQRGESTETENIFLNYSKENFFPSLGS